MDSPTPKQMQAIEHIRQGLTARQAMLKAGYAESTADNPGSHLWGLVGTQLYIAALQEEHLKEGSTLTEMAQELANMLKACKADGKPDWPTRIKAQELWRRDMGLWEASKIQINQLLQQKMGNNQEKILVYGRSYDDYNMTAGMTKEEVAEAVSAYKKEHGGPYFKSQTELPAEICERYMENDKAT